MHPLYKTCIPLLRTNASSLLSNILTQYSIYKATSTFKSVYNYDLIVNTC